MAIDDNKTYGLTGAQVKDLVNGIESKQNTLTPGSNIQISNDIISATDTTYTAGTGLNLAGTQFSIDTSVVAEVSDIPTKTSDLTNDGENGTSTYVEAGDLATVATTGSYSDLSNTPTIGNATITIQKNGTDVDTFTTNATSNKSINIGVPTKTSDLTNNGSDNTSTYVEADELATVATSGSYADLLNTPTIDSSLNTSSNNAVRNSTISTALNDNVMTGITVNSTPSTTTVQLDGAKKNLYSGSTTTSSITLPVASTTQAGVMNSSTFDAVTTNSSNINALMNGAVAITGLSANPSQSDLTTAWQTETGLTTLINRASIYDVTNQKVWTYYTNDTTWYAASNSSQVTVSTWTNSSEGVVLGSTNDGQIFAESDGTGSVNGWDTLKNAVSDNTSKLATIAQGAEVNVQANWNEADSSSDAYIQNKPTIPTVNNATLTITQNGTSAGTFTANASSNKTIALTDTTYSAFTGATSSAAGSAGLVPAPTTSDPDKFLKGDGTWSAPLVEMSYGESSAWAKFIAAYQAGSIVYCRASSNSNPATGTQGRKAFMAYVNNDTNPTEVEFQYVRSVSSKTSSQPVDQVFVYKLTSASGGTWSVVTRDMAPKLASGTNANVSYSNGTYTISATDTTYSDFTGATSSVAGAHGLVPAPTTSDADKYLKGDGTWATVSSGPTYTAGTGIDITNNAISIDTSVVAELSDLPSDFTGATSSVAGAHGLVPAPTTSDVDKYLKGDGTWGSVAAPLDVFTTNEWNALWA